MNIDKKEVLRYLGYRGQKINAALEGLINECIEEVKTLSNPAFIYEICEIEDGEEGLWLKSTTLTLRGRDIRSNLAGAKKCALMAVTLGLEIDRHITLYSRTDVTRGLIFDACATAAIESCCDILQEEIRAEAEAMGFGITPRYSPGYGDFPIETQKEIVRVLGTYKKIGLCVNESSIMIPRKSVTAIIGMQSTGAGTKGSNTAGCAAAKCEATDCDTESCKCGSCEDRNCLYRRDDSHE